MSKQIQSSNLIHFTIHIGANDEFSFYCHSSTQLQHELRVTTLWVGTCPTHSTLPHELLNGG